VTLLADLKKMGFSIATDDFCMGFLFLFEAAADRFMDEMKAKRKESLAA